MSKRIAATVATNAIFGVAGLVLWLARVTDRRR